MQLYDQAATTPPLLAPNKQQAAAGIDWAYLLELLTFARHHTGPDIHIGGPRDTQLCGGSACLDGAEADAEYVITHRTVGGVRIYPTPVCRSCLVCETTHLRTAKGTDPQSIRVTIPAPLLLDAA